MGAYYMENLDKLSYMDLVRGIVENVELWYYNGPCVWPKYVSSYRAHIEGTAISTYQTKKNVYTMFTNREIRNFKIRQKSLKTCFGIVCTL